MKKKILYIFLTATAFVFFFSLTLNVNAAKCDYVNEDGYCVTVVDNKDKIPSLGDMTNDSENETGATTEVPKIDTTVIVDNVDRSDASLITGTNLQKIIEEYRSEYWNIKNSYVALEGSEEDYVNARLSGKSYAEAYRDVFSINYATAIEEITEELPNHKNFFQDFINQMNSETVLKAVEGFAEMIKSLFE